MSCELVLGNGGNHDWNKMDGLHDIVHSPKN